MTDVQFNSGLGGLLTSTANPLSTYLDGSPAQTARATQNTNPSLASDAFGSSSNINNSLVQVLQDLDGLLQELLSGQNPQNASNASNASSNASSPASSSGFTSPNSAVDSTNGKSSSADPLSSLLTDIEKLLQDLLSGQHQADQSGNAGSQTPDTPSSVPSGGSTPSGSSTPSSQSPTGTDVTSLLVQIEHLLQEILGQNGSANQEPAHASSQASTARSDR